ncbi:hypothetical protein A3D84_03320 [Candidatus Woesebacteria bacterium RIFCSPHIGHO2_02_FULL_42_20]|uniref:Major facilitator superfamily (MFS) profile domain-containing protein n=1 Tax=Candidatus Woesebacteria bacterium RIFCSPHIGHO2_12_FULL_41_24 TaxID=1802510 RepID=A0A1F8AS96_9BACT|nr:MAG: hypothetical protein A2W15_03510 [Candidatus Woesebacteria bacterium RBG_16_41_13]OGM34871.1 MAG: hypothetical protein A3D84_03320 [Candidatus Woesebacteria bacterium RIFCSPHIGHO2_02_FULL_42_20]OGM54500.1 MAG: hypothetical protein A3E44_00355 [Candidatus Woesebacteria bacterium RIFCSPHIGHO2_12_FULL_41_24]OGM65744.1 MAG: hypothetical protein A2969_00755 [Candidatus Woesebacteria bacterium RIFCSPLOWO2_01_FULL_42_67]OGM71808.1 MAG: hypothetical protein A3I55_00680 [Candidatus Woesebacteria
MTSILKENRNILVFYILSACMNFFFLASNWIYFWTKFMTYGQLGWIDALGFGFALFLEIPSGAIADLLGKKKTIQVGLIAGTIGAFMISGANNLTTIFIGWLMVQIAYAFYSGAGEALAYDTLVQLKRENEYDVVITKSKTIETYTTAFATFFGGFMYEFWFRLPHYAWGFGFLLGAISAFWLFEPKVDTIKFSFKTYFEQLFIGAKELFSVSLRKYVVFILILLGVYYLYSWGFIRPAIATSFGFYAKEQSIIIGLLTLISAFAIRLVPKLREKISDMGGLVILSLMMAIGFFAAAFPIGYWGVFVLLTIAIAGKLADPWISVVINREIPSKYRATTLSTAAFITRLPYVLIAVVAGSSIQAGKLSIFNLWVAGAILLGIFLSFFLYKLRKVKAL